ncbi:MAG: L-threonylcarbamoyladenylate synthase [Nitrosomonas sp.]|nr:L-threonylcarbamoyladenylate synthase [Nitrosomonas sp.]
MQPSSGDNTLSRIAEAAVRLNRGELVAFPTETVYGLGAEISQARAIDALFAIKGRPRSHPLIVHFADPADIAYWAENIPEYAWQLIENFWPGPLTLIVRKSMHVPLSVTGGQDTVGLRIPRHPLALALLTALGSRKALAAPSANRFGHISPTLASHVEADFGNQLGMILDGGACAVGLESTIISCVDHSPQLLRPGGISPATIEHVLKCSITSEAAHTNVRVSGSLVSHYAPVTPFDVFSNEMLISHLDAPAQQALRVGILIHSQALQALFSAKKNVHCTLMPNDPENYGKRLYATLRALDQQGFNRLLAEAVPDNADWLAITDRLQRASHHLLQSLYIPG